MYIVLFFLVFANMVHLMKLMKICYFFIFTTILMEFEVYLEIINFYMGQTCLNLLHLKDYRYYYFNHIILLFKQKKLLMIPFSLLAHSYCTCYGDIQMVFCSGDCSYEMFSQVNYNTDIHIFLMKSFD